MTEAASAWTGANQRYLVAALGKVRKCLEAQLQDDRQSVASDAAAELAGSHVGGPPPALDSVQVAFGLSPFERDVLLLCAGVELDATFAALVSRVLGREGHERTEPTFSLALASLPGAHWSAITPAAPLRRWRLIEAAPGHCLTTSPLRIDERILHHLTGVTHVDERLSGAVRLLPSSADPLPSQRDAVAQIVRAWTDDRAGMPLVQLCGPSPAARRTVAVTVGAALDLAILTIPLSSIPAQPAELEAFARLCEREAVLLGAVIVLEHDEAESGEHGRDLLIGRFAATLGSALIFSARQPKPSPHRRTLVVEVGRPTAPEQRAIWRSELGEAASTDAIEAVVSQFDLDADRIRAAATAARALASRDAEGGENPVADEILWDTCRRQLRPRLDNLVQRIEPGAVWRDLVLPSATMASLRDIGMHVRHRATVYERWGFAERTRRGLGISALFVGGSGTGKTMAAETLASELRLDLYRIDLSQVVSKYIGETEKNLSRVFDAAEEGGAVLLFDEADALFGKRTEVKDSHDRYANIEISYLLQRMEAYRGLAILTTNMKDTLDTAFLRRLRFVIDFPFPDPLARADIWRGIFPAGTPIDGLDPRQLAQLNLSGGSIRNVALGAAFLAAEAGTPVRMELIARAAQSEYAKLGKTFTATELGRSA